MRKAEEERWHEGHGQRGAVRAGVAAVAASTDSKALAADHNTSTTIGRYIARFRYEQPLPREARSSVQKEDFWWKSGGGSLSHRRSRVRQRSTREGSSKEREEGGGGEDDDGVSSLAMSGSVRGSVRGSVNSVESGYERYIPESQVHQEAYDTPVAVAIESQSSPVAGVRASGDSDALLLLSSASWSSLPSDLELPSSSQESLPRDLTRLPSRAPREIPHFIAQRHSVAEAATLGAQADDEDNEDDDDESKVEDAELVIERVRKRLGWSSSDGGSDAMSFKRYDALSSSSPVYPMTTQWRRRPQRDYEFPLATSLPVLSGYLGDDDHEDDEILSGTMRVGGNSRYPTHVVSSENRYQPQDQRQFDVSALAPRATADPYAASSSSGHSRRVLKNNVQNGLNLDQLAGLSLQAHLNGDATTIEVQRLDNHADVVAQMELSPQDHGSGVNQDTTAKVGTEELVPGEDVHNEDVEEAKTSDASKLRSGDQTVGVFAPLQSVESPVVPPVWRRGPNSSLSSSSATSSSFPPRLLAPSLSSSLASAPPRSSTESSLSSVTAETAKTLDGLVSLVVQSWSNDFFFRAENDDKNGDGPHEASESVEKETIGDGDGGENEDEPVGDLTGQEDIRSVHESVVEARVAPPLQVKDESSSQIPGPPLFREENPVSLSLFSSKLNDLQPAAGEDGSANSVQVDPNATSESYDSEKEEEENAETGDDEDDEIVRLLLSRIALYEEALRRLEAANTPPPDEHGDADE